MAFLVGLDESVLHRKLSPHSATAEYREYDSVTGNITTDTRAGVLTETDD